MEEDTHTDLGSPHFDQPQMQGWDNMILRFLPAKSAGEGYLVLKLSPPSSHHHLTLTWPLRAASNLAEFQRAWAPEPDHLISNLSFSTFLLCDPRQVT